jgi:hypothetical protein
MKFPNEVAEEKTKVFPVHRQVEARASVRDLYRFLSPVALLEPIILHSSS